MRRTNRRGTLLIIAAVLTAAITLPYSSLAGVCQQGIGIPPFLDSGADPNLMLVIDNSGSMLDMAYTEAGSQCFDDSYNTATEYAGYYESDKWYVFIPPVKTDANGSLIRLWANGVPYTAGDLVYANGGIFEATETSTSNDPDQDDGYNISEDEGVEWSAVSQADALTAKGYLVGDFVSYNNMLFQATTGGNDSGKSVWDTTAETGESEVTWLPLESYFDQAADETAARAVCRAAAGEKYNATDLCVTIDNMTVGTSPKTYEVPEAFGAFAAKGNFLNWASSSKFDIQKEILTGGKYDKEANFLVSESRGCAGSGFVKQVAVLDSASAANYLVLRVKGANDDNRVGPLSKNASTDDTARIEIIGVNDSGFDASGACQGIVDDLNNGNPVTQNQIDTCLGVGNETGTSQAALSTTVNVCRQFKDILYPTDADVPSLVTGVAAKCADLFTTYGYYPSTMDPEDGGYVCYGIYDNDTYPHYGGILDGENVDHTDRTGYLGRCWDTGVAADCNPKKATASCTIAAGDTYCMYTVGSGASAEVYKNDSTYNYKCNDVKTSPSVYCKNPDKASSWDLLYVDSGGSDCTPGSGGGGDWFPTWDASSKPGDAELECITQAMIDFCGDLKVPEVIDPSDQSTTTTDTWNLPAMIIDGGVLGQFGVARPVMTMKGFIDYSAQEPDDSNDINLEDDNVVPDGPRGIFYNIADDLRLGTMAFTDNGASYECEQIAAKCEDSDDDDIPDTCEFEFPGGDPSGADCLYCAERQSIEKYCPGSNADGAEVKVAVGLGLVADDAGTEDWSHYLDLVDSVNDTRATAWTPLAEAMHTAIGYFSQNPGFCLETDPDTNECLSYPVDNDDDPVQYWCQDNHVLVITEGASTADIHTDISSFLTTPSTLFVDERIDDDTGGDGDVADQACTDGLEGSTYMDDMTWWGQHLQPLYATRQLEGNDKQGITTHIVTTGSLRTDGTGECSPATLMENAAINGGTEMLRGENPAELESNLLAVLNDIFSRASAGSAASVISASRSGSGAVYQAIFWPKISDGSDNSVEWVGDLHALFLSSDGLLYEDTNGDGVLVPSSDLNNNGLVDAGEVVDQLGNLVGDDKRVLFYYSKNTGKTRACYDVASFNGQCSHDPLDPISVGTCGQAGSENCSEIKDVKYLWSANDQLRMKSPDEREIYTWNDLNNDGKVDEASGEIIPFTTSTHPTNATNWAALNTIALANGRGGNVTGDFLTSDPAEWETLVTNDGSNVELDAMNGLVSWIRGADRLSNETVDADSDGRLDKALRSRQFDFSGTGLTETWKLGDIIHSTPTVVGAPAEAYHFIYRDPTYAAFTKYWKHRRQTVYYGGNDGMLHAVNGGYYYEHLGGFCCEQTNSDGVCERPPGQRLWGTQYINGYCPTAPNLGEELWAYIPYNLAPHLKCLTDPDYKHKYFVDQKPRIFDVQIFEEDTDHVGGWGTILVGAMRFGGAPINAYEQHGLTDHNDDDRIFTSAYFVLDITNPDNPSLLGEMTMVETATDEYTDLNYTTSSPTVVVMKDDDATDGLSTKWYLILGNGPTDLDGTNTAGEQGRLAVIPLNWLAGNVTTWTDSVPTLVNDSIFNKRAFRIPNRRPDATTEGGRFLVPLPPSNASFLSDLVTVDFDVENAGGVGSGAYYKSDAVYFGTTDGTNFATYADNDTKYWPGGGRLFRLVTKAIDGSGDEIVSSPSEWNDRWVSSDNDPVRLLVDAGAPITAPPTVGYDGESFWVYSGTGRFFDKEDKMDREKQRFFGIREPVYTTSADGFRCQDGTFNWATINWDVEDDTLYNNQTLNRNNTPGSRGLLQTDAFLISEELTSRYKALSRQNVSYLDFGFCYDNDENSLNADHCVYDTTAIAALAGVDDFNKIYWPDNDDLPTTKVYEDPNDQSVYNELITFDSLQEYIAGTGCSSSTTSTGVDGWYREFHDERERNIGQAALLGGLLVYTGYRPDDDICEPEGESFLYGIHYQTGTAWKENVFGLFNNDEGESFVRDRLGLGQGLATTPSMHVGTGDSDAKAFIQTSTGEIVEIEQESLPLNNTKSGRTSWSDRKE